MRSKFFFDSGKFATKVITGKEEEGAKFKDYFEWSGINVVLPNKYAVERWWYPSYYDAFRLDAGTEERLCLTYMELDALFSQCDIVSLHLPLIPGSEHLIDERRLGLMKPSAYLLNMARGPHVDMTALDRALNEGKLAGAALDVVENEHLPELGVFDHPIFSNPKVFFTPHTGWYGEGSRKKARVDAAMDARAIMEGREPKNRYA